MNDTMDSCRLSFENNSIAFLISTEWINEYQFITTQSSHFVDYIFIKQIIFFIHIFRLHLLSVLRWLFFVPNKLFVYGFDERTKRNRNNSIDHSAGHFVCVCVYFFVCFFVSFVHFILSGDTISFALCHLWRYLLIIIWHWNGKRMVDIAW